MPMISGYSPESIGKNIALFMREGKPHAQSIAIALEHARREYRKAHPIGKFPRYLSPVSTRVRKHNPERRSKSGAFWDVYLDGKEIDSVWFTSGHTAYDVKTSLVDHDGYDPRIVVKQHRKKRSIKNNPVRKKSGSVIMVFGHGQKGYWTGKGWNTSHGSAHRFASVDSAKNIANTLTVPVGYRIAIATG